MNTTQYYSPSPPPPPRKLLEPPSTASMGKYVDRVLHGCVDPQNSTSTDRISSVCAESYIDLVMNKFLQEHQRPPASPTPSQMSESATDEYSDSSPRSDGALISDLVQISDLVPELSRSNSDGALISDGVPELTRSNSEPSTPRSSILKKQGQGPASLRRSKSFDRIRWKHVDDVLEFKEVAADEEYQTYKPRFAMLNGQRITLEADQQVVMDQWGQQFVISVPSQPAPPPPPPPPRQSPQYPSMSPPFSHQQQSRHYYSDDDAVQPQHMGGAGYIAGYSDHGAGHSSPRYASAGYSGAGYSPRMVHAPQPHYNQGMHNASARYGVFL